MKRKTEKLNHLHLPNDLFCPIQKGLLTFYTVVQLEHVEEVTLLVHATDLHQFYHDYVLFQAENRINEIIYYPFCVFFCVQTVCSTDYNVTERLVTATMTSVRLVFTYRWMFYPYEKNSSIWTKNLFDSWR